MKVEVKKVNEIKRELRFEIPKERVTKTMDAVYGEIGRKAKIKGFRPGKAPRHVLEAHHSRLAEEETIQKVIPEAYQEAVQKEGLSPLDLPEILDVSFKDGIVKFTAKLDIRPEIKVKNYKGIKVKRKDNQVTDDEINKMLDFMKKGQGKDDAVVDDAFARGLGYPNLEDFKNSLRRQLELDKDRQSRADLENQVAEELLKQAKFPIPDSLVEKQVDRRVQEAKHHHQSHQSMSDDEWKKKEDDMRKELKPIVERDIKLYFILEKIAETESIDAKQGENLPQKVMEYLLKEANWG